VSLESRPPSIVQLDIITRIAASGLDGALVLRKVMAAVELPEPLAAQARAVLADMHELLAEQKALL
jgi:hypothetical protein